MGTRFASLILAGFFLLASGSTAFAKEAGVVVKELAKTEKSWDDALLPAYPDGQPEIRILSIKIPAGQKLAVHKHPVINAGVLLSGQLRVHTENGQVLDLHAGEAIVEVVNTWHWGESVGDSPAHIIVFYAGTADTPVTVIKD
ncbi:quercetin dioxygenase-like cupin family protein [Desulfobotulus alkaliphilus]|uniref:Quercetin dioxygenase-like cupin family protein n=1 Tax=Desulfobotulus alkaliphilus TaxID=622671 RepID=A0A562RV93_9BACT|nr:cupin domain-containing protein [Desulfobotulus alkaliphilus]TWI72320.1 quercetin dioxygenase-like cupin family protein [Desulfobotulus alkaliphilus]